MIKVAFVRPETGEIEGITAPYDAAAFPNGVINELGQLMIHIPFETDNSDFARHHFWYGNEWIYRNAQPSRYHSWDGSAWVKDEELFNEDVEKERKVRMYKSIMTRQRYKPNAVRSARMDMYEKELENFDASAYDNPEDIIWPKEIK